MTSQYDDLEKLADLKNKGIITEEEFNLKKSQILNLDNKQNISKNTKQSRNKTHKSGNFWKCKKCGEEIEKGYEVCRNCGTKINGTPPENPEEFEKVKKDVEESIEHESADENISVSETALNNAYTKQQSAYKSNGIGFKIIGTIINIIILGALIITNPTKADFQDYISKRINESPADSEESVNKFFSALATLGLNLITERDNYVVCSVYTINTNYFKMFSNDVSNNPKFLGIFGHFIPLNVAFKDKENVDQIAAPTPGPASEGIPPEAPKVEAPVSQQATNVESTATSNKTELELLNEKTMMFFNDPASKAINFLLEIQNCIRENNKEKLASLIHYPITIYSIDGKDVKINNEREFISNYEKIAIPKWKEVILTQQPATLFVNYRGFMVNRGELWFGPICLDTACQENKYLINSITNNTSW